MQQRWKLIIEYSGPHYAGWQRQDPPIITVQGQIEAALKGFCQRDITLMAAGRTDSGVHGRGQVAHFDLDYGDRPLSGYELAKALNAHLRGEHIAILSAEPVTDDFHARFSAVNKMYLYRILCRPAPAVLERGLVWWHRKMLDADAMHDAAQELVGHHDFTTFRDTACQAKSPERSLDRFDVTARPHDERGGIEIRITAEARSFLHHQMRNMVGTLALVGEGKWSAKDVRTALQARDRTKGGPTAPPEGLYLMRVDY
ncbi:MAG: tRNA pseudouridine(38-40) synthase TruA [Alphaproteobacteria bacterium]|nr:tRNA pseudouridine(38-40) synthase TruA [Alphaproteobacteria bacterium]